MGQGGLPPLIWCTGMVYPYLLLLSTLPPQTIVLSWPQWTLQRLTHANNNKYVRNLRRVSSATLCQIIDAHLPGNFYQMTDVDTAHQSLVNAITVALDRLAPLKIARTKQINGFTLSLADDTLKTMRQRDSTYPTNPLFRVLRNKARKLVRRDALRSAMKEIDAASSNTKKLWDFARQHMGYVQPSLPTSLSASEVNHYYIQKIK